MKLITVIGARPQFIKAATVSRLLREQITELYIHTGQHYDDNMSDIFFRELSIPQPDYNLGIGGGLHGSMTGEMLGCIEKICLEEKPDSLLVYGDTNSTLAGALAAVKLHIPVIHVEAGLRSFNRQMPEEINRLLTDHISSLLFCPTQVAINNLAAEGVIQNIHLVGDVMLDSIAFFTPLATIHSNILEQYNLSEKEYLLVTLHRAENVDDPIRLIKIVDSLLSIDQNIMFPVHPRTLKQLINMGAFEKIRANTKIRLIDPVGYLDMIMLEKSASIIMTDSGGVQKEAYWFEVPCITLREETEWTETVDAGWNRLVNISTDDLKRTIQNIKIPQVHPAFYGNGEASVLISDRIVDMMQGVHTL
ncbi:MAG: UDP-N-acetylglucosamine 2-epimerase (non-hydrolyzing) [Chloroflexi bacterium HGW-Chloroflexi-8]|nr:MAG: UDP-N-acetylglucosamine 2-epimerase (non-hydrolyzing) [Chloroflexi bacterium HGW-Chloroflexi-8]